MESRSRNPRNSLSLRLFWGIAPTPELHARIAAWRLRAEPQLRGARWVQPGDAHFTLAFLGSRPEAELDQILAAGRMALAGRHPFPLRTAALGGFPASKHSRVLWLGVEPEAALGSLAEVLQGAMTPFGCRPEQTRFHPHLTLARFGAPLRLPPLPRIEATIMGVDAVHLFLSEPLAEGTRYRSLGTALLSLSSPPAP